MKTCSHCGHSENPDIAIGCRRCGRRLPKVTTGFQEVGKAEKGYSAASPNAQYTPRLVATTPKKADEPLTFFGWIQTILGFAIIGIVIVSVAGYVFGGDSEKQGRCVAWGEPNDFGHTRCEEYESQADNQSQDDSSDYYPEYDPPPANNGGSTGGVDCGDFDTHREAQAFFESNGGPNFDPYDLDGDSDGSACELLT